MRPTPQPRLIVPRGQVPIPPEVFEYLKELQKLKGGITAFTDRAEIKSDTLRLAMKRGTTTERTLKRIEGAMEKSGVPVLASKSRIAVTRVGMGNGHAELALGQIAQLPPAMLRRIQRVSSALLDGMQLMQLTVLKVIQEELVEDQSGPASSQQTRTK